MELLVGILSLLLGYYIFRRSGAQISVKTCLSEEKIDRSVCGKTDQIIRYISIAFINRSTHPIRIDKIIAFHYQKWLKDWPNDTGSMHIGSQAV